MRCVCLMAAALLLLTAAHDGWAQADGKKAAKGPARITDGLREETPNDFLRVTFVSAGTNVTSLARPGAQRAFATATAFYLPPLPLKEFPLYSGLVNDDTKTLVALRCRPAHPETVDATLATWPNLFHAIERDMHRDAAECSTAAASDGSDMALQAFCFAHAYNDPAGSTVPKTLAATFDYAAVAFDAQHTQLASWLRSQYGVFPAFSGLGFSVKDSYYLDTQPMSSAQLLVKSVSPEYVLKNVSLREAGCRCISVAPYPGRAENRLDPKFIAKAGGNGECRVVKSLTHAR
ncbi:MAG TPA: hypothetical protein VHZ52_00585 [Acidobacteriaceae bacterium]|nr:hypothetical protein [Acidobacteriaceae bacterium]